MSTYLAIDIGASSGRHILGRFDGEHLRTEEIYRFQNGIQRTDEGLVWDISHLTEEVINGLRRAGETGCFPDVIAIDTWGVDYVLLDKDKKELLPVFSYRDDRTIRPLLLQGKNAVDAVREIISPDKLYERTGIQFQPFNTIFQLYCDKISGKLERAEHFLMIPEYLAYRLTGEIQNEYTNATTTNLVHAESGAWDMELIKELGYPEKIFSPLRMPSAKVGELLPEIQEAVGFNSMVIFCPTHDTASAVCGSPIGPDDLYLSSGTWSLMGMESEKPELTQQFQKANFTNEGGIEHRFRVLKNIMGMWLIQNIRANLEEGIGDPLYPKGCTVSFDEMVSLARASSYQGLIDVNDERFVAPENMAAAIKDALGEPELSTGDIIRCVYRSLAEEYRKTVLEMEALTGKRFEALYIVGGGCQNEYLNKLTAETTGKKVFAGPVEATACGNLISQLMFKHPSIDLWKARRIIRDSFEIKEQ